MSIALHRLTDDELIRYAKNEFCELASTSMERELLRRFSSITAEIPHDVMEVLSDYRYEGESAAYSLRNDLETLTSLQPRRPLLAVLEEFEVTPTTDELRHALRTLA